MRIKKDHIVNDIFRNKLIGFIFPEGDEYRRYAKLFYSTWSVLGNEKTEKYFLSKKFFSAFVDAQKSITTSVHNGNISFDTDVRQCYIYNDRLIYISITISPYGGFTAVLFNAASTKPHPTMNALSFLSCRIVNGKRMYSHVGYSAYARNVRKLYGPELKNAEVSEFLHLTSLPLFLKYADVETKILPPKSKIKAFNCRYTNSSQLEFTILDSTWLTNLVKSDEFKVRGHFRLQPCGEGLKDRKLIWINEFKKSGYTRKAGLLKQQDKEAR